MAKAPLSKKVSEALFHDVRESMLVASNAVTLIDTSSDPDFLSSVHRECRYAWEFLGEMRSHYVSVDQYRKALLDGVRLHDAEADLVISNQNRTGAGMLNGVRRLTKAAQIRTEQLQAAFQAYLESPACRVDVTRDVAHLEKALPKDSVFYPFMAYLHSDKSRTFRAEAIATLSVYVDAGWAERDLTGPLPDGKEGEVVQAFRDMYHALRAGKQIEGAEVRTTMQRLFAFRKEEVKVQAYDKSGLGYVASRARDGSEPRSLLDEKIAGPGFTDIVMRDAKNPKHWHVATVTACSDSASQGDQLPRHVQAIQQSIKNGLPPFSKDDTVQAQFFSIPLLFTDEIWRNQVSKEVIEGLEQHLTVEGRMAINAMALFAQQEEIHRTVNSNPEIILQTTHRLLGAKSGYVVDANTPIKTLVKMAADIVAQASDLVKISLPYLDASGSSNNGALVEMIELTSKAVNGLLKNFAHHEECLASLTERRESFQEMGDFLDNKGFRKLEGGWSGAWTNSAPEKIKKRATVLENQAEEHVHKKYQDSISVGVNLAKVREESKKIMAAHLKALEAKGPVGRNMRDACVFAGNRGSVALAQAIRDGKLSASRFYEKDGYKYNGVPIRELDHKMQDEWIATTVETPEWQARRQRAIERQALESVLRDQEHQDLHATFKEAARTTDTPVRRKNGQGSAQ